MGEMIRPVRGKKRCEYWVKCVILHFDTASFFICPALALSKHLSYGSCRINTCTAILRQADPQFNIHIPKILCPELYRSTFQGVPCNQTRNYPKEQKSWFYRYPNELRTGIRLPRDVDLHLPVLYSWFKRNSYDNTPSLLHIVFVYMTNHFNWVVLLKRGIGSSHLPM